VPDGAVTAVAYFRTREGGPSLEEQERLVAQAARAHGLTVAKRLNEVAGVETGDVVDRRVKLFELLAEAQSGRAGAVIISRADAIAEDPVEATIVAIMLERSGCEVVFGDEFDLDLYRDQANRIIAGQFDPAV
jgi:DNA invertase Pin-like site-specific DNA recombinase